MNLLDVVPQVRHHLEESDLQVERDRVLSVGMSLHDPYPAQTRATHRPVWTVFR